LVSSLSWLAQTTRPDLFTVDSLLAQHQSRPSPGHLDVALHTTKYLATAKHLEIYFISTRQSTLESFLHYLLPPSLLSTTDLLLWLIDNWNIKEILLKRLRNPQNVLYMQMSLQVCRGSGCSLLHSVLSKMTISGTVSLDEKVAQNMATSNLNWETGKV